MHRSGTSLVARLFYELGEDMGEPEGFYTPDRWNPDGYFEQRAVVAVNKKLLHGPWWKFSYLWLPSEGTILRRAEKNETVITEMIDSYRHKTVKDPRFCLTLPAWLRHGAPVDKVLVCLRKPVDVALSLRRRDGAPLHRGLHLWYAHNLRLCRYIERVPSCIVLYENLLREESSLLEMRLALSFFGYRLEDKELESLRDKCIRSRGTQEQDPGISHSSDLNALWETMLRLRPPATGPTFSGEIHRR